MWETLYIESSSETSTYYWWRENVQNSSLSTKNAIKDNPTPHQKVRTSELGLHRKQKASEAQLLPKRFNLLLETQHPTYLKKSWRQTRTYLSYLNNRQGSLECLDFDLWFWFVSFLFQYKDSIDWFSLKAWGTSCGNRTHNFHFMRLTLYQLS